MLTYFYILAIVYKKSRNNGFYNSLLRINLTFCPMQRSTFTKCIRIVRRQLMFVLCLPKPNLCRRGWMGRHRKHRVACAPTREGRLLSVDKSLLNIILISKTQILYKIILIYIIIILSNLQFSSLLWT